MLLKGITSSFANAWDMLIDFPLPKSLKAKLQSEDEEDIYAPITQMLFPVIGVISGLIICLLAMFLSWIPIKISGAIIFAITLALLSEFASSGRSLGCFISFFEQLSTRKSPSEALLDLSPNVKSAQGPISTLSLVLTILFKILAFFMMFYYNYCFWIVAVYVLTFTVQGHLAAAPSLISGEPLLEIPSQNRLFIWAIAAFFVLFVLFNAPYASLIAFALAFVFASLFRRYCEQQLGGVDVNIISFAGYTFELAGLALGLLFLSSSVA
jgi:cobalamin synthase